jgi:hypothetical protein
MDYTDREAEGTFGAGATSSGFSKFFFLAEMSLAKVFLMGDFQSEEFDRKV